MRARRSMSLVVGLGALVAALRPALADSPYPVVGEPVLKPDSQWVKTDWGYQKKALVFPDASVDAYKWPVIFTMEGYGGAGVPNLYLRMDDGELIALRFQADATGKMVGQGPRGDYLRVYGSIRGTECSGGSFNLYDRRHAWDGHHIVEWIAAQSWSNGSVGMIGSSFSGQTAYWVASTQPPHLKAISSNLLHSDIYRDIFMPGGIQNYLFPVVWYLVTGPHRAPQDRLRDGTIPNDEICTQAQASRYFAGDHPAAMRDALWAGIEPTDNDWYASHAAANFGPLIKIPYYQQNNWQDEQTGPRAAVLWNYVNPTPRTIIGKDGLERTVIPKKMAFANGSHGYGGMSGFQMWDWFDIWLLGRQDVNGLMDEPVTNYFEMRGVTRPPAPAIPYLTYTAKKSGPSWPFPDTTWARLWLHEGRKITASPPTGPEAPDTYLSGVPTRNWTRPAFGGQPSYGAFPGATTTARGLPDAVVYESEPLPAETVIAGPIVLTLYASIAGIDADFFASISDVYPDGSISYLQRGLLKASHRRVDPLRSFYNADELMVQPYRPHTNPQPVTPGEILKYDIEIWPLGHIFRPGHRILIQVHTPPAFDGIWGYTATQHQPGAVTLYHDADHPSSLLLPVVTPDAGGGTAPPPEGCQVPGGFACVPPSPL